VNLPASVVCPVMDEILATMYFCEPVYRGEACVEGPALGAKVEFSGPFAGEFRLVVARGLASQLAADFLGADLSEVTLPQVEATVVELANVACGFTMSAWLPAASFHYSVPAELAEDLRRARFSHCFSVAATPDLAVDIALPVTSSSAPGKPLL